MANFEHNVPNTPQTKFRIGSLTKQFTATAIMQLIEKGLLELQDTLEQYLPDYLHKSEITIHQLLTHTSGIPNVMDFANLKKYSDLEKTINKLTSQKLDFEPGSEFGYSNSGYIMLAFVIERITRKSYESYMRDELLVPAGMVNSGYDDITAVLKNRASGYIIENDIVFNAPNFDLSHAHGAGALYSTVEDLFQWHQILYTEKILRKETLKKMFTSYTSDYGYGWGVQSRFNQKIVGHAGTIDGFSSHIVRFIDDKVLIVLLCNSHHDTFSLIDKIVSIIYHS
jgi:CubicO group peptidase (beta-lactamase class C family)